MTIEKRQNGKYTVKIWDPLQRKHVNVGTYSSHSNAKSAERKAEVELEARGFLEKPKDTTLKELCESFLQTNARVKESTRDWYRHSLKPAREFLGDGCSVRRLTRVDVTNYVASLTERGLAAKTIVGYIKALRVALEYGIEAGYLDTNPARKLRNLPENKRCDGAIKVLTRERHERLVGCAEPAYRTMLSIWPFVGLRLGEMQGLTWPDVDLEAGTLRVRFQLREDGSLDPSLKTKKSARVVKLPSHVVVELKAWKLACPLGELDLVFPSPKGRPQNRQQFYKVWRRTCVKAELEGLDPHDMRHTFATWSLMAGETAIYVAGQMGHEKPSMTLDTYSHLLPDERPSGPSKIEQWYVARAS